MWSRIGSFAGCVVVIIAGLAWFTNHPVDIPMPETEPEPTPQTEGITVDLNVLSLPSVRGPKITFANLKGNVVVLNVFATWCGPCMEEVPHLIKLHEEYAEKGLVIVAICRKDEAKLAREFVRQNKVPYLVLIDEDGKATDQFSPDGDGVPIPTNLVLDANLNPVYKDIGHTPKKFNNLRNTVTGLLN